MPGMEYLETEAQQPHVQKQADKKTRDHGFDNIRAILIICVVFGHMLEICPSFPGKQSLYQVIYSFHMPVFIFLVGYFARYQINRILFSWIIPYVLFQTLYIAADQMIGMQTPFQYATPYWHLWFLVACTFYQLLIPAYNTQSMPKQIFVLICSTALALAVGFDRGVSQDMALSRFFVFQPWFVLGYYSRGYIQQTAEKPQRRRPLLRNGIILGLVAACIAVICLRKFPNNAFYGSYPYEISKSTVIDRGMIMAMGLVWIALFMYIVKPLLEKKIPLLTTLGKNTFPVFLLHAAAIRYLPKLFPQAVRSFPAIILTALFVLLLCGNSLTGNIFRFLFSERLYQKIRKIICKK